MRLPSALVLALTLSAGTMRANAADTPAQVFASYGLTGAWSEACDQPPSPHNPEMTLKPKPDGLVDDVIDFGADGSALTTFREAYIDQDNRLHTTSFTEFANAAKAIKEAFSKTAFRPDFITTTIVHRGSHGEIYTDDKVVRYEGFDIEIHLISGGYAVNQQTREQGVQIKPIVRCSE